MHHCANFKESDSKETKYQNQQRTPCELVDRGPTPCVASLMPGGTCHNRCVPGGVFNEIPDFWWLEVPCRHGFPHFLSFCKFEDDFEHLHRDRDCSTIKSIGENCYVFRTYIYIYIWIDAPMCTYRYHIVWGMPKPCNSGK